jgi:signal transduction histidine kinase
VRANFNIKEALNEILESYQLQAQVRLLKFNIIWGRSVPDAIYSDKIRLQQIIRNIVSNALNFTKTSIEIEVS